MSHSLTKVNLEGLFLASQMYLALGYSVIPVHGDKQPELAKVAAVKWSSYQHFRPTEADLQQWFMQQQFGGLAIVTGQISQLIVLDFDDAELAAEFQKQFPDLIQTRTIKSAGRGLPHYYYRIPQEAVVQGRKVSGVDLQGEGRYVIAPPTQIKGSAYTVESGGQPRTLTMAQIGLILRFIDAHESRLAASSKNRQKTPVLKENVSAKAHEFLSIRPLYSDDLVTLYRHHAAREGRNNALFRMACCARDRGWSKQQVLDRLCDVHASEKAETINYNEGYDSRRAEAYKTIQSAFSRPPGKSQEGQSERQLPNSVREKLMALGLTSVARVLDGLLINGISEGQTIFERNTNEILTNFVGRYSVLKALNAQYPDGEPVFVFIEPSPEPPSCTAVAEDKDQSEKKICYLFTGTKPNRNLQGRPARRYIVPTIAELCHKLKVKRTASDPIQMEDLASVKTYRQALHRELIKRRPGRYLRWWLAKRLGVSQRTCRRYEADSGIKALPLHLETVIHWRNLAYIPLGEPLKGTFLEDETGKKYPALRQLAMKLLSKGRQLVYKRRDANYYHHQDVAPVLSVQLGVHPDQERMDNALALGRQFIQKRLKNAQKRAETARKAVKAAPAQFGAENRLQTPAHQNSKQPVSRCYRQALSDGVLEQLANTLYRILNTDDKHRLSLSRARRLVDEYGGSAARLALDTLEKRDNVHNPAGFVVTLMRSTARFSQV